MPLVSGSLWSIEEEPRYRPPEVKHLRGKRSDNRATLCLACSKALKLAKGETRVLCFYGRCSNGFRPSLQYIADESGVSRRHVERIRTSLVRHGLIAVDHEAVYVDWNRIRLFSTLDPKLTSKNAYYAPVEMGRQRNKIGKPGSEEFFLFASPKAISDYLGRLSDDEYNAKVAEFNEQIAAASL